ncbi:hypothetical protein EIP91_008119 [Steccherinum ochraceum]|uniref:F-box domain-containing protein n=1 Tax=Steccherinum ochraceum TaxID=92696 RepID=A0A4R0R397_9APHY|nr:hypothetical protein EIP91_008119 [Steccherinum ochraceum]
MNMDQVLRDLIPSLKSSAKSCHEALAKSTPEFINPENGLSINDNLMQLGSAVKDAREAIWHLKHITSHLLIQRNASPGFLINKLPNEVLAMVFCEASRIGPITMFAIAHTCSRWRHLAFRTPYMWTTVDLRCFKPRNTAYSFTQRVGVLHPKLAHMILTLSKDSPMSVYYPDTREMNKQGFLIRTLDVVMPSILNRLVEMIITVGAQYATRIPCVLETTPAPVLRKLSLKILDNPCHIFKRLFAGETPQLKTLRLSSCRLPWNDEAYPASLEELIVDEGFDLWSEEFPYQSEDEFEGVPVLAHLNDPRYALDRTVASALQKLQRLRTLKLDSCSNLACGISNRDPVQPASLSKLRSLKLRNGFADSVAVLTSLSIGKISTLLIRSDAKTRGEDNTVPTLS